MGLFQKFNSPMVKLIIYQNFFFWIWELRKKCGFSKKFKWIKAAVGGSGKYMSIYMSKY